MVSIKKSISIIILFIFLLSAAVNLFVNKNENNSESQINNQNIISSPNIPIKNNTTQKENPILNTRSQQNINYSWWNNLWHYRVRVDVKADEIHGQYNTPIQLSLNFTDIILPHSGELYSDSIRVIEYYSYIDYTEVESQFVPTSLNWNNRTNAFGDVIWILNGTTLPNQTRTFFIYFGISSSLEKEVTFPSSNLANQEIRVLNINFEDEPLIESFGESNDLQPDHGIITNERASRGNHSLNIFGNCWKVINLPTNLTLNPNKSLTFSIFADDPNFYHEIVGIGITKDDEIPFGNIFYDVWGHDQIGNTTFWNTTQQEQWNYYTATLGIDAAAIGLQNFSQIVFVGDDDDPSQTGNFYFDDLTIWNRNVNLTENYLPLIIQYEVEMFPIVPHLNPIIPSISTTGIITLTWEHGIASDFYKIYRDTKPLTTLDDIDEWDFIGKTINCTITDIITENNTYYYALIAENSYGFSILSNTVNVSVEIPPSIKNVPNSPFLTINSTNPNPTGEILLVWTKEINAEQYFIFREETPITTIKGLSYLARTTDNTYKDTISKNGTYFYVIVSSNETGWSAPSNCVNITVGIPFPSDETLETFPLEVGENKIQTKSLDGFYISLSILLGNSSITTSTTSSPSITIHQYLSNPTNISIPQQALFFFNITLNNLSNVDNYNNLLSSNEFSNLSENTKNPLPNNDDYSNPDSNLFLFITPIEIHYNYSKIKGFIDDNINIFYFNQTKIQELSSVLFQNDYDNHILHLNVSKVGIYVLTREIDFFLEPKVDKYANDLFYIWSISLLGLIIIMLITRIRQKIKLNNEKTKKSKNQIVLPIFSFFVLIIPYIITQYSSEIANLLNFETIPLFNVILIYSFITFGIYLIIGFQKFKNFSNEDNINLGYANLLMFGMFLFIIGVYCIWKYIENPIYNIGFNTILLFLYLIYYYFILSPALREKYLNLSQNQDVLLWNNFSKEECIEQILKDNFKIEEKEIKKTLQNMNVSKKDYWRKQVKNIGESKNISKYKIYKVSKQINRLLSLTKSRKSKRLKLKYNELKFFKPRLEYTKGYKKFAFWMIVGFLIQLLFVKSFISIENSDVWYREIFLPLIPMTQTLLWIFQKINALRNYKKGEILSPLVLENQKFTNRANFTRGFISLIIALLTYLTKFSSNYLIFVNVIKIYILYNKSISIILGIGALIIILFITAIFLSEMRKKSNKRVSNQ